MFQLYVICLFAATVYAAVTSCKNHLSTISGTGELETCHRFSYFPLSCGSCQQRMRAALMQYQLDRSGIQALQTLGFDRFSMKIAHGSWKRPETISHELYSS